MTQDFIVRVFEEVDIIRSEIGEEDIDAGKVWAEMSALGKWQEYSDTRFVEHPSVSAMLIHSLLETKGAEEFKTLEAIANDAFEKATESLDQIKDTAERAKKSHEEAANALNQVNQLKESVKKSAVKG